jgi:hypothetical protein
MLPFEQLFRQYGNLSIEEKLQKLAIGWKNAQKKTSVICT